MLTYVNFEYNIITFSIKIAPKIDYYFLYKTHNTIEQYNTVIPLTKMYIIITELYDCYFIEGNASIME